MNRIIKFKAWDKKDKVMIVPNGLTNPLNRLNDDRYIHLQFTGLPDKNGKEIYEGDILKTSVMHGMPAVIGVMEWHARKAQFGVTAYVEQELPKNIEVNVNSSQNNYPEIIGNIFENPEIIANLIK